MNCKVFGRKRSWPNFKVLSWHSPGGTEEFPVKIRPYQKSIILIFKRSINYVQLKLAEQSRMILISTRPVKLGESTLFIVGLKYYTGVCVLFPGFPINF
jgi:hypothetical protein